MTTMLLALACVAALLFASTEAGAAEQGGATPVAPVAKPEQAAKPENDPPDASTESDAPPEGDSGPLTLAELTRDGFVIRATNFIPAEAVTRQSGKVSSDAFIVTLQTATSTAVCFYTLKAYVGKKLTTIPACTVHR